MGELKLKTQQVEPLANLPEKVDDGEPPDRRLLQEAISHPGLADRHSIWKACGANEVTIEEAKYKQGESEIGRLLPVEVEADLSGNYVSLARFINALERDDMLFIISSVTLEGEQKGPIKLQMKVETYLKAGA